LSEKKPWYEDIKDKMTTLEERSLTVVTKIAYLEGQLDEMKRHNSKMVKILVAIIGVMGAIIVCLLEKGAV